MLVMHAHTHADTHEMGCDEVQQAYMPSVGVTVPEEVTARASSWQSNRTDGSLAV
jgi:hypothetical protein